MLDCSFEELVNAAFEYGKHADSVHSYYREHALRSKHHGYNHVGWARIGEAVAKSFVMDNPDIRIMTDKFILSLAIKLSDHFQAEIDNEVANSIRKVN